MSKLSKDIPIMKTNRFLSGVVSSFTAIFIFAYICIPLSRIGNTGIYTGVLGILTAFAAYIYVSGCWGIKRKQVRSILYIIIEYIVLSLFGFAIAAFFTDAMFGVSAFVSNKFILLVYAFTFSVLCQDRMVRNIMIASIIVCSFLVSLYTIFCYVTHTNPYITYIELRYNVEGLVGGENMGFAARGLTHRVSGNIGNPVYFGGMILLYISISFIRIKNRILSILRYVVIAFLCVALLFTGSRSSLGPLFLFIVLYIYRFHRKRLPVIIPVFCMLCFIALIVLAGYIDMESLFASFTANSYDASGSSFEMRFRQLNGLLDVVGDKYLFGNGVGWINNYVTTHGMHPVLEGFESIILSAFTEGGMWGLFIVYPLFLYRLDLFIVRFSKKKKSFFPRLLLFIFIIFSLLTGMYGIKLFLVFMLLAVNSTHDMVMRKRKLILVQENDAGRQVHDMHDADN